MKGLNVLFKGLSDALALTCCMLAAVCALPTSFQIGFSLTQLILFCGVAALLLSLGMNVPRRGVIFGAVFLAGMLLLIVFRFAQLRDGAIRLIDTVLNEIGGDYTILSNMEGLDALAAAVKDPVGSVTTFLAALAALVGLFAGFALIRGRLLLLPALIPLPLFLLGMIYTNCRPALWTAILMAVWCAWSLLGHGIRKGESVQAGVFFASLAAVLTVLMFLILAIFPERSYTPISFAERKRMLGNRMEQIEDAFLSAFGRNNPNEVNLTDLGDRYESETTAFELSTSRAGTYLLRTHSYGVYQNGRWLAAKEYDGAFRSMEALGRGRSERTVLSVSGYHADERLVPYGFIRPVSIPDDVRPGESASYTFRNGTEKYVVPDESYVSTRGRTSYLWSVGSLDLQIPRSVTEDERAYIGFIKEQYVMADGPEKDALAGLAYANGIDRSGDAYETAQAVARFVRRSGTYTTTPERAPEGTDFVLYFLTQSHEGYCVHFASATTAILQALDVPARYTVGYSATVTHAGGWTQIPEKAAHAWAEVYVEGVGWVPIESTAGFVSDPMHPETVPETTPVPGTEPPVTPTPVPVTPEPTAPPTQPPTEPPTPTPEPIRPVSTPKPGGQTGTNGQAASEKKSGGAWWLLLLVPIVPAAWAGVGTIVRRRREALFRDKNVRRSIPEIAAYLRRLERFGAPKDPDADAWAEEAAFSDHKMRSEHRILLKRVRDAQNALYKNAPVRRFFCRWVLFLI